MTENIAAYFEEILDQLRQIEEKYNPKENNLHFAAEAIPQADEELFCNLLQLSGKAIAIVKDEKDHYLNSTPYAGRMFKFWYDYFMIVSSASIRVKATANSADISQATIYSIIKELIYISEFSIIVSGDLYKRNYEALGNTLLAFYSDDLMNLIKKEKTITKGKLVKDFLDMTIERVETFRNNEMVKKSKMRNKTVKQTT